MEQQIDYQEQSYLNQIADYAKRVATLERMLTEKVVEIQELKGKLDEKEIEEMNAE